MHQPSSLTVDKRAQVLNQSGPLDNVNAGVGYGGMGMLW